MTDIAELRGDYGGDNFVGSSSGFNQMTGNKLGMGIDNPIYSSEDVYNDIEQEREDAELNQMMNIINQQQQDPSLVGGSSNEHLFADNILNNSQGFKIFSSVFMDIKDPLIMLLIASIFLSKPSKKFFREKVPFLHDPETGTISYSGMLARFVLMILIFFVLRRMINSYFNSN